MNWQLTAKAGPKRGESWTIGERPMTVGRSLSCEINIEDPTVSRRHCQVYLEGEGPVFRDLGSRNVTLVNGTVVSECRLALGDELAIGSSIFILTRTASPVSVNDLRAPDSSPSTVSLNRALFGADFDVEMERSAYPATARDVLHMFQFGKELSKATCEEAFASRCVRELEARFSPECVVALWCGSLETHQCYPASYAPADEILEQVRTTLKSGQPTMARHQKKGRLFQDQILACTAPLVVAGQCRGVMLVTAPARRYVLNDDDLERLCAMAQTAAPFQVWRDATGPGQGSERVQEHRAAWRFEAETAEPDSRRLAAIIRDTQVALDASARETAADYEPIVMHNPEKSGAARYHDPAMDALENAEKTLVRAVLSQCGGDVAQAARIFGTSAEALQPMIDALGIAVHRKS